jgi:hypothetical protein
MAAMSGEPADRICFYPPHDCPLPIRGMQWGGPGCDPKLKASWATCHCSCFAGQLRGGAPALSSCMPDRLQVGAIFGTLQCPSPFQLLYSWDGCMASQASAGSGRPSASATACGAPSTPATSRSAAAAAEPDVPQAGRQTAPAAEPVVDVRSLLQTAISVVVADKFVQPSASRRQPAGSEQQQPAVAVGHAATAVAGVTSRDGAGGAKARSKSGRSQPKAVAAAACSGALSELPQQPAAPSVSTAAAPAAGQTSGSLPQAAPALVSAGRAGGASSNGPDPSASRESGRRPRGLQNLLQETKEAAAESQRRPAPRKPRAGTKAAARPRKKAGAAAPADASSPAGASAAQQPLQMPMPLLQPTVLLAQPKQPTALLGDSTGSLLQFLNADTCSGECRPAIADAPGPAAPLPCPVA